MLFLVEVWLALSLAKGQFNLVNALTVVLMYFVYSQMWVILVVNASFREAKRVLFNQESKWYKTERFDSQKNKQTVVKDNNKRL